MLSEIFNEAQSEWLIDNQGQIKSIIAGDGRVSLDMRTQIELWTRRMSKKNSPLLSPYITLNRALISRLISVRLGNALLHFFSADKAILTLGDIRTKIGSPIDPEIRAKFLNFRQFGKAAMLELDELLNRIA